MNILSKFNNISKLREENKMINYVQSILRDELPHSHFIPMPNFVVCDKHHKWGMASLHFTKQYYEYVFNVINIIVQKYDLDIEKSMIQNLAKQCESWYRSTYFIHLYRSYTL